MGLFRFLFSKSFIFQLILASLLIVGLGFGSIKWLDITTNHDQKIDVPFLDKMTFERASYTLYKKNLVAVVQDSANFNPNYPPYSVIEQTPKAGSYVKENRKIYLVLNPSDYRKIKIPNIVQKTRRQAEPTLKALDFKIGEIIYRPNIARNIVLGMRCRGREVKVGDLLRKTSTIDLIVGDGSIK